MTAGSRVSRVQELHSNRSSAPADRRTVVRKFDIPAQDIDPVELASTAGNSSVTGRETFCVRFSPDSAYLAAAFADGSIGIFHTANGRRGYALTDRRTLDHLPATQVRWRPSSSFSKTKNVLVNVTAEGIVQHWHITSHKLLHEMKEEDQQLYCFDYLQDGSLFATAGRKREIKVYDEATKKLSMTLAGGDNVNTPGHSNRVFSLKWHPTDKNMIVTGGWDNTVQFWDIRKRHAVRSVFGPHIRGDSVDISQDGTTLLTGSWRNKNQLQLWDTGSGQLQKEIPWNSGRDPSTVKENCMVYAAQFSKDLRGDTIIAGGSGSNEVRLFDRKTDYQGFATIPAPRACYTVDISPNNEMIAFSGGDSCIRIMTLK